MSCPVASASCSPCSHGITVSEPPSWSGWSGACRTDRIGLFARRKNRRGHARVAYPSHRSGGRCRRRFCRCMRWAGRARAKRCGAVADAVADAALIDVFGPWRRPPSSGRVICRPGPVRRVNGVPKVVSRARCTNASQAWAAQWSGRVKAGRAAIRRSSIVVTCCKSRRRNRRNSEPAAICRAARCH